MKYSIFLVIAVLLLSGVAFVCEFDREPIINQNFGIEDKFFWYCTEESDTTKPYSCFSTLQQDGEIVQVNPEYEMKKDVGLVYDYFKSERSDIVVHFTDKNIYTGVEYNASVICNSEELGTFSYSELITPQEKQYNSINYRLLWIKDNLTPIIFVGMLVIFVVVMGLFLLPPEIKYYGVAVILIIAIFILLDRLMVI